MQRIARIYVDRFGSPTGWYEQTLFDLVDPDTGIPVDSIINLENAGGKTSLLSYIFSCFDPAMDRWLQTMQNKDHHFRDYFARDARPSFIIMEWVMPPRGPNMLEYRLVIGQAVAVKEAAERGADIDRRFFAFESMNGLCLEDIPAPGLALLPVQNMPDFVKWMQQGAKQSSGDFFYTSVQDDWTRHLGDRRLLDIELLRMQVAFNSKEGGNDDGFLVFSSEFELISRLLMLCLNIETAQAVRKSVAETIDRLKAKPKYEARLAQLLSLQQAMTPFSAAAAKYAVATANLKETNQEAANLYLALEVEAIAVKGRIDSGEAAIRALNESASTAEQNCLESRRTQVALMGLQHERKVETGKADFEEAERHVKAGHHRLICLRGAQAEPLQLRELEQCVAWLERTGAAAREEGDLPWLLRCCRDPSPAADRFLACHPQ